MSDTEGDNARVAQEAMVREIVATIIQNQADAVTRLATDAVQAVMGRNEERLADDLEERLRKKDKREKVEFKNEGNKDQYKHQKELLENMEGVEKAIRRNDATKASELIEEGKKLIEKRIKLIKIADREDWGTVKEYVSDDLASDTEDEKALTKAIKQATAKREKKKKQKPYSPMNRRPSVRSRSYGNPRQAPYRRRYEFKPQTECWSCAGHMQWQCYTNQKRDLKFDNRR